LKLHHVSSEEEAMDLVWRGSCNRNFTATLMNENSSRSHCIFSMVVRSQGSGDADEKMRVSKLHLVDLAGSERVGKSGSEGKALTEAKNINLSLHHLVRVIDALAKGDEHIPYRDSTMTMFLRDSLGGNCKTAMIANINPCIDHLEVKLLFSLIHVGNHFDLSICTNSRKCKTRIIVK
jgi:kinesin family protein 6/9